MAIAIAPIIIASIDIFVNKTNPTPRAAYCSGVILFIISSRKKK
jgi:hypothetical protein